MKKKTLLKLSILSVLSLTLITPQAAFAQQEIPAEIQQKIDENIRQNEFKIPEHRAWETDMNGNTVEVIPLSERVQTMAPPTGDGYIYSFDRYDPDSVSKNWRYQNMGTFRVANNSAGETKAKYEQQSSSTATWNVTASIKNTASLRAGFLAGTELEVGIQLAAEKNYTAGKTYGVEKTIPAYTTMYLTNYAVGVNTAGKLIYKKYAPGGTSQVGVYTEQVGGTVVSVPDVNIEIN
ncbi:hypothetical protein [Paenibacillus hubeiensis]|uniref:hypothetical protein n=1 Tax=Paenibacillus hubeiensis TaxID=3077330 RepID=UPI0031B9DAEA